MSGAYFPKRAIVVVSWDGSTAGMPTTITRRDGTFTAQLGIPSGAAAGSHTVRANADTASASTTVTVIAAGLTVAPTLTVAYPPLATATYAAMPTDLPPATATVARTPTRTATAPAAPIATQTLSPTSVLVGPATATSIVVPLRAPTSDEIPEQFIVVLRPGRNARSEAQAATAAHGVAVRHVYEHSLVGFAFRGSEQAAVALTHNPNVQLVSRDRVMNLAAQTLPTGVDRIDADLNDTARIDGVDQRVNVNVAILDTGIDPNHPDLNVVGGKDCGGYGTYNDGHGHGTHVAGTVGALDNDFGVVGVAPGARLWAVKVLSDGGSGPWSDVICGIDWAAGTRTDSDPNNEVAVVNMSLGGSGSDDGTCGNTNNDALHQAICSAVARGVVFVVAAGNNGGDAAYFVPAAYDEVLTVAAIADSDGRAGGVGPMTCCGPDDGVAGFSNYGADVDIAAPGAGIYSTYKGGTYSTMSGTSMASPHVAGAVALYVAVNGKASDAAGVTAIRTAFTDSTRGYSVEKSHPRGYSSSSSHTEPLLYLGPSHVHDVAATSSSAPSSALQGDSVSIAVGVANEGTYSESFSVTLTDTTAGTTIGTQSATLAANASTTLTFAWATSSGTALGDHVLSATASQVSGETDTADNNKSTTITLRQPVHDVAVTDITAPTEVAQGATATVQVMVMNQGTYTENTTTTLRDVTTGVDIGMSSYTGLAAGASYTATFPWTPSLSSSLGAHTLVATTAAVAGESDTADNSKGTAVTVVGAGAATPTPASSLTRAPTSTPTATLTSTASATATLTPTLASSPTSTPTDTRTPTASPTSTRTPSPTNTPSIGTPTASATVAPAATPTNTPTPAPSSAASLAAAPSSGKAGASITVNGVNFPRRADVVLTWDGSAAGMPTAVTRGNGSFSVKLTIPSGAAAGGHSLRASASGTTTTTTVVVIP